MRLQYLMMTNGSSVIRAAKKSKIKNINYNTMSASKKNVDKCTAAVLIKTRSEVNDIVLDGKAVFSIAKGKTREYYKRCTKSKHEDSKQFCKIHEENSLHGHGIMTFADIMKSDTALQVDKDKLLDAKTKSDDDPMPIFRIIASNETKKMFKDLMNKRNEKNAKKETKTVAEEGKKPTVKKEPEPEPEPEQASSDKEEEKTEEQEEEKPDEEEKTEEQEEDKAEEKAESDEDNDDEKEVEEIKTKKGEALGFDKETKSIYRSDSDGDAEEIGTLFEVKEKDAPISYETKQCIVGKEFEEKNVKYMRCVLSDKLYLIEKGGSLKFVGTVKKDGKGYKAILKK